jgi:phosphoserine phosphatase RsbU/P
MTATEPAKRILIVDDEKENVRAITRELRQWSSRRGITMDVCYDGQEAMEFLKEQEYGVIITDNRMPGMSGTDLVRRVGRNHPTTVSIILTGYTEKRDVESVLSAGIFSFLTKPWDREGLRLELEKALNVHYMRKRHLATTRKMNEELRMAVEFQKRLHQFQAPTPKNDVDISYAQVSADSIGFSGDYLDIIPIHDMAYMILMGDVSGHGLRTTFVTAMLKAVLTPQYMNEKGVKASPAGLLAWINCHLCEISKEIPDLFVAAGACCLDTASKKITYSIAGNPAPLLVRNGGVRVLEHSGTALGMSLDSAYDEVTDVLEPGDSLYLFTDGIWMPRKGKDRITPENLSSLLSTTAGESAKETLRRLMRGYESDGLDDDVTLISLTNKINQ